MNEETLIGIIGDFCDDMVDNDDCKDRCPFAFTKDEYNECEVWRTIASIREGRDL